MAYGPERLLKRTKRGGIRRMRVNHAIDIRARLHDLGVNENFGVALMLPFQLFPGPNVHDNDMLRPDLFEAKAVRLHQDLILAGNSDRHVAENIIPVPFVSKNIARIGQGFFQLFDAGHGVSLADTRGWKIEGRSFYSRSWILSFYYCVVWISESFRSPSWAGHRQTLPSGGI